MKIYIVNWKETTIDEDGIKNVESGVCDYGYRDEDKALEQLETLVQEKVAECIDEMGYDEKDVIVSGKGDSRFVVAGFSGTYNYFITIVNVD